VRWNRPHHTMRRVPIMTETAHTSNSSTDIDPKPPTHSNSGVVLIDATAAAFAVLKPNAARTVTAGENPAEFDALAKIVAEFWQPQDVIEQLLMTDYINAQWELQRLRRLVPAAFIAGRPFAVSELEGVTEARFSESAFPTGQYKKTLASLAAVGHTPDILDAHVLLRHAAAFESFDKRAAVLEMRRDGAWDKVERRRSDMKTISSPALHESGC
jgi:hypothetical protein